MEQILKKKEETKKLPYSFLERETFLFHFKNVRERFHSFFFKKKKLQAFSSLLLSKIIVV